jgi:transcription initiation factor TFIID subunit 5
MFNVEHGDDLRKLRPMGDPKHIEENDLAKLYVNNKYRLTLTEVAFQTLVQFLESKEAEGGSIIIRILNENFHIVHVDRANLAERTLSSLMNRSTVGDNTPAEDEGIPGHGPGSAATDPTAPSTLARLSLGHPPADPDFIEDVRAQLQEEDAKNPHGPGQQTYVEEFEQRIKQEQSEDAPSRDLMPIPPLLSRDVAMEVQRVKENRDRFKLEGRTGGIGPGVSVAMYTFMNTNDR